MTAKLSPGKWHRLCSLSDDQGRLKMMAIDQRGSLEKAIAKVVGKEPSEVTGDDLSAAKQIVTKVLAPYATAVLMDPVYGHPHSFQLLPPGVALLLAHEESGYEGAGVQGKERKTRFVDGWTVDKARLAGADAVKLLVYYRPDGSDEICRYQQELVQRLGQECEKADMPFLLELVSYAIDEGGTGVPQFAAKKPKLVIDSAAEFSKPQYKVDILKLEFPADLKHTREFGGGAFDGKEREAVYTLGEVRDYCRQLNDVAAVPWVILSAGVDITEFLTQVDFATEAGASGFLCGRAIWKDAINLYPSIEKMGEWLRTQGAYNFVRAIAHAHQAQPWFSRARKA
jgi:tagatose 1,6-diphosphate aldolase